MPKIFSEHERAAIRASMLEVGGELLRRKGLRQVSVEDIVKGVHIAKGTFYTFYDSRELLLWDVIEYEDQKMVDEILAVASEDLDLKEKAIKILRDICLREDSIVFCLQESELAYLTRKLPPEVLRRTQEKGVDINRSILTACGFDASEENVEVLTGLLHTLRFACTNTVPKSKTAKRAVQDILVEAIAAYFCGGGPRPSLLEEV